MEGTKVFEKSYNHLVKLETLCNYDTITIDYRELDNKTRGCMNRAIGNTIRNHIKREGIDAEYERLRRDNMTDVINIDYTKLNTEMCCDLKRAIKKVITCRKPTIFRTIQNGDF